MGQADYRPSMEEFYPMRQYLWIGLLGLGCHTSHKHTSDETQPVDTVDTGSPLDTSGTQDTSSDSGTSTDSGTTNDSGTTLDSGDTNETPFMPTIATSQCTAESYEWLDSDQVGGIIDWEEVSEYSLDVATINAVFASLGLNDIEAKYGVTMIRVRYTTQNKGEQVEATGWFALPNVDEPTDFPLLLWLHPTMGFSDVCGPTNWGLEGAAFPLITASTGMVVAAPDYLGMNGWGAESGMMHPYVIAEPTAIASLDAARALLTFQEEQATFAQADPDRLLHWGISEGGFAALWTDRYQPNYAPEFTSVGVVAAIPPTDLGALGVHAVTNFGATTAGLAAVLTTASDWCESDQPLTDYFTDEDPLWMATNFPDELMNSCDTFPSIEAASSVEDIYTPEFIEAVETADWTDYEQFGCIAQENSIRISEIPYASEAPMLMVIAENDSLAIADPAREDLEALCEQGYQIEHIECADSNHSDGAIDTIVLQFQWLIDRSDDVMLDESVQCVINEPMDCDDLW